MTHNNILCLEKKKKFFRSTNGGKRGKSTLGKECIRFNVTFLSTERFEK